VPKTERIFIVMRRRLFQYIQQVVYS